MNIGNRIFIFNRERSLHEVGTIVSKYRREKVQRYDVQLERGILLEFLSTSPEAIFFIDSEKTKKFFDKLNPVSV